jgi:hypothetical protein
MATKNYEKAIKTGYWKQSRTQEYADLAKESYLRISKRSTTILR